MNWNFLKDYEFWKLFIQFLTAMIAGSAIIAGFYQMKKNHIINSITRFTDRLLELNKLTITATDARVFIDKNENVPKDFYDPNSPKAEFYCKVRAIIYYKLNRFEAVIGLSYGKRSIEKEVDFEAWKKYIIESFQNKLLKRVYKKNHRVFSVKFRTFVEDNKLAK